MKTKIATPAPAGIRIPVVLKPEDYDLFMRVKHAFERASGKGTTHTSIIRELIRKAAASIELI